MKFRALLLASAVSLLCIGGIVAAEPPIGSRLGDRLTKDKPVDEATSIKQAHAFATCIVNKRGLLAKRLLDQTDKEGYAIAFKALTGGEIDCYSMFLDTTTPFIEGRALQMPSDILRGLLAEELILRDLRTYAALSAMPRQLVYSRPWYGGTSRDVSIDEMATCVSETAPFETLALLKTGPQTEGEATAFAVVVPYMGSCLRAGVKLTGNRQSLRAALADAIYQRVANPAPAAPAAQGQATKSP